MANGNGFDAKPEEVRSSLRWLVVATLVLYGMLAIVGTWAYLNAKDQRADLEAVITQTNQALCAVRHSYEERVRQSEAFLEANPDGFDGIKPALIKQGISQAQATVDDLSGIECPPEV